MEGITDDKLRIKENLKKIKEKLIQRINQMENELTNKLDILVQENTKFQQDEMSKVLEATEKLNYTSEKCCLSLNMDQKNKPSFYVEK